jgi:hypothetical protein
MGTCHIGVNITVSPHQCGFYSVSVKIFEWMYVGDPMMSDEPECPDLQVAFQSSEPGSKNQLG